MLNNQLKTKRDMVKMPLVVAKLNIKNCLTQNKAIKVEQRNKTAGINYNMIGLIQ